MHPMLSRFGNQKTQELGFGAYCMVPGPSQTDCVTVDLGTWTSWSFHLKSVILWPHYNYSLFPNNWLSRGTLGDLPIKNMQLYKYLSVSWNIKLSESCLLDHMTESLPCGPQSPCEWNSVPTTAGARCPSGPALCDALYLTSIPPTPAF